VNGDNTITYTPAADYSGPDSFTYRAWDGALTSNAASVSVTVNHVNQAPTISVDAASNAWACSATTASGTVTLTATDPDGDPLTWSATSSTVKVLANAGLVFGAPGATRSLTATGTGTKGSSTITVTISDGSLTGSATISFRVGGAGKDTLTGGSGPDMLFGLGGNDKLNGSGGNDLLCGAVGNDTLTGGTGADYFSGAAGTDTNTDFGVGDIWDGT
jgi:Ca2+-binding RTX toxin-like protein